MWSYVSRRIDAIEEWLRNDGINEVLTAFTESTEFQQLLNCPSAESMQQCLDSYSDVANKVYEFDELRNGAMSSFWQSYIEMIQIFFDYLRSIRLGDWDLSQKPPGLMLPWFHVYGRRNYARYFAYCWASRHQLPITHPRVYTEFKQRELQCPEICWPLQQATSWPGHRSEIKKVREVLLDTVLPRERSKNRSSQAMWLQDCLVTWNIL